MAVVATVVLLGVVVVVVGCLRGVNGVFGTGAWRGTEVVVEGKGVEGWRVQSWRRRGRVGRWVRGVFGRGSADQGGGRRSEQDVRTERTRLLG